MTLSRILGTFAAAAAVSAFVVTSAMAASVAGKYKRPNGKSATVSMCGSGLRAVASNGTVMFKCAKKSGNKWRSNNMKHPEFPGTFVGTIVRTKSGLNVQGCFGPICPAENWTKK